MKHNCRVLSYGQLGMSLAHEWMHCFDYTGRMYDKNGNMKQWWTNEAIAEYNTRASCFIKQYNNYYVEEISGYVSI